MSFRIVYLVSSLRREAAARRLALLLAGLSGEEFAPEVIVLEEARRSVPGRLPAGVPVEAVGWRGLWDPRGWRRLIQIARRPIDVLHVWDAGAMAWGWAASCCASSAAVVVNLAEIEPFEPWRLRTMRRRLAARGAVFVAGNPAVREHFVCEGISAEQVRLIAEGTSTRPTTSSREQVFGRLGLPRRSHLIGVCAPLRRCERLKDAIWVADLLKVIRDDVHMVILGEGPQRERLRWFRDQVRIADKVHFLGPDWQVAEILPHCDVFLATGETGGAAPEVLEAMAAGVPVVAVDVPVLRHLVEPGQTGLMAPVGDRAGLTRCIQRLLEDRQLAQRMGHAARQRAEQHFPLYRMVRGYLGLYRELSGSAGGRHD